MGERAFEDKRHAVSRASLERLIQRFPADARIPEATLLLGKVRLAQGGYEPALAAFRQAQTLTPPPGRPEEPRFWEAETLFRMGRYDAARAVYDALIAANAASPFAPDALYGLAWSQLELKRREGAVAAFRQLLEAFPEHVTAPSATYHLARALVEGKRHDEAIGLLRPFPEKYRDSKLVPDARYLLGVASLGAGHASEGIAELRAFISAYPGHGLANQARRTLVDRLVKEGRKDDLAQEYKTLMAQSPPTAEGIYDAGFIATRLGRPRDAEAAWSSLRKDFPDHPLAARASYDLAQGAFGRGSFKDAAALARGAAKSPDEAVRAQAQLLVGESELKLKRPAPAHPAFQAAVEGAGSRDPAVRFRALAGSGLALEEQGKLADSLRYYDQVAADAPDKELRAWAKARRTAVAAQLNPVATKPAPKPAKPGETKSGKP
ncbi:MAG TPA: tetratricopeptide repeat protein [Methylomirabilota bacterium]|nr:tetratricopeptide repeat protein [Methylomirabilota bacterium]